MISTRSKLGGTVVRLRHGWAGGLPAWGQALALPLMVVALAGCGGEKTSDASTHTPSAVKSSAPAESQIQQAVHSCELENNAFSPYASLGDGGYILTMKGEPATEDTSNYGKVTGLRAKDMACVLKAVSIPDSVVREMDATRAVDGYQRASWDKFAASWWYHPGNGLMVTLTESKQSSTDDREVGVESGWVAAKTALLGL